MKKWFLRTIAPTLAAGIIHTLAATIRLRLEDPAGVLKGLPSRPVIFAFWHNRLLLMPCLYRLFYAQRKVAALISRSRDGEVISNISAKFGVAAVRGSSSNQAVVAFREMMRKMENENVDVVITPDGPRGPRYHLYPGVLQLSQLTGAPIIPATYYLSRKWEMRSWDKFQIPKPFALCHLVVAEPFVVPPEATDLVPYAERLTRAMGRDCYSDAT